MKLQPKETVSAKSKFAMNYIADMEGEEKPNDNTVGTVEHIVNNTNTIVEGSVDLNIPSLIPAPTSPRNETRGGEDSTVGMINLSNVSLGTQYDVLDTSSRWCEGEVSS